MNRFKIELLVSSSSTLGVLSRALMQALLSLADEHELSDYCVTPLEDVPKGSPEGISKNWTFLRQKVAIATLVKWGETHGLNAQQLCKLVSINASVFSAFRNRKSVMLEDQIMKLVVVLSEIEGMEQSVVDAFDAML